MAEVYHIESKTVALVIEASDTRDAFRKFMRLVVREGSWRRLGLLAIIRNDDKGKQAAMRTVDALVLMECLTEEEGLANIQSVGDFDMPDFHRMLEQSRWILEEAA